MDFTTVNLSGLDSKTIEKSKFAIQAICDRIKVPSNQVSIIDGSSSNGLSNGGELREGDLLKYKAFERLLNKTFVKMAKDLDLVIDYKIYNKPIQEAETQDLNGLISKTNEADALNGAQISSLLEVLASVSGGLINKDAAINIIKSAFPQISEESAEDILEGVKIGVSVAVNAQ